MALLLDTHTLLWWLDEHPALSPAARRAISDATQPTLVSSVSAFEIATKHAIGNLGGAWPLLAAFERKLEAEGFAPLPVEIRHAVAIATLPLHHRDPFDRLLIAQALVDDLTIVSIDDEFDRYGVRRVW